MPPLAEWQKLLHEQRCEFAGILGEELLHMSCVASRTLEQLGRTTVVALGERVATLATSVTVGAMAFAYRMEEIPLWVIPTPLRRHTNHVDRCRCHCEPPCVYGVGLAPACLVVV